MKVLIINICLRPNSEKIIFPIGLGYIATAIERAGFDFEILDLDALRLSDEEIEKYLKKTDFDVVALGCIVTGYRFVKKIATTIKKYKNVLIIAGNSVATSIPELLLKKTKVDIGVMGEGDITIVELLKAIENKTPLKEVKGIFFEKEGKVFFTEPREIIANLDELPFINYELFDMKTYLAKCKFNVPEPYPVNFDLIKALPLNTARGCPYNCTFCYHVFKNKRYRTRPIEHVVREIKYLQKKYDVNYVQFFDELTLLTKKQANNFADHLLKENIKVFWAADCRAGLLGEGDLELARKLKRAGCVVLGYSLESADEEILKAMQKHITPQHFEIQTKVLQKAGIYPASSLVIGYPQETEQTLKRTFDCCYNCDIYPSAGYLLPQPGTPMYEYALKTGKIQDEEEYLLKMGDRQDFTINLTNMKQERIEQLVSTYLKRIAQKLSLPLPENQLIKTGHYRQMEKTFQEKNWTGEFGDAYTKRNPKRVEEEDDFYLQNYGFTRTDLNQEFLGRLDKSMRILEVGANVGVQLALLQKMGFENLYGIDINRPAIEVSKANLKKIDIIYGSAFDIPFRDNYFDLVFTSGVLIHIAPSDIKKAMAEIVRCAKKYIWGFEYYAPEYQEILYRGKENMLWKANFSKIYLDSFNNLKLVKEKKIKYLDNGNIDVMFLLKKV